MTFFFDKIYQAGKVTAEHTRWRHSWWQNDERITKKNEPGSHAQSSLPQWSHWQHPWTPSFHTPCQQSLLLFQSESLQSKRTILRAAFKLALCSRHEQHEIFLHFNINQHLHLIKTIFFSHSTYYSRLRSIQFNTMWSQQNALAWIYLPNVWK